MRQRPFSLRTYAYPTIGGLTVAEIKPSHIVELLESIWVPNRDMADRLRGSIATIIETHIDEADFRNPAELTNELREELRQRSKRSV